VPPAGLIAGRALSTAFGLLMAAASAIAAQQVSLVAAAAAAIAVVLGVRFAWAATLAVMMSVVTAMLADTPPMGTALAGLAAAAYLVLRHARNVESVSAAPTIVGALSLTAVALGASVITVSVPWVPLAAPVVVLLSYLIVVQPLLAERRKPTS
jgi:hypothetical protein